MVALGRGGVSSERGTPVGFRGEGSRFRGLNPEERRPDDLQAPLQLGLGFRVRVWGLGFGWHVLPLRPAGAAHKNERGSAAATYPPKGKF